MTTHQPSTSTDTPADHRLTLGLFAEITATLEKHGYSKPTEQSDRNRSTGATLEALLHLVRAFEGEAK